MATGVPADAEAEWTGAVEPLREGPEAEADDPAGAGLEGNGMAEAALEADVSAPVPEVQATAAAMRARAASSRAPVR